MAEAVVNPTCCTSGVSVAISNLGASINDHGVVAFQKSTIDYNVPGGDAFQGIYLSNGAIVYEAHSGDPSYKSADQFTTINDNGDVAFRLQTPGGVDYVVVKSSGGVLATIAATSADGYRGVSWPLGINNAGKVVFLANPIVNGAVQPGYIYASAGGLLTTIYEPPPLNSNHRGAAHASINDSGNVALSTQGGAVFVGDGISLGPVFPQVFPGPGMGDPAIPSPSGAWPSINNLGEVAYLWSTNLGSSVGPAIAVGPDPAAGRVIGWGDPLDGSNVWSSSAGYPPLGPPLLNDRGQVAFAARLSDGRIGLYVATPLEPGDFDGDGDVDGADLATWQAGFGDASATRADGDADRDGDVDGQDFLIWQRARTASSAAAASTTVPEPTFSLSLVAAGAGLLAAGRRRRSLNRRAF